MVAGIAVSLVPSAWLELPVANRQAGIAVAGLGVVVLYAGGYDRFDSESETGAADPVTQTPTRTTGPREIVHKYVSTVLFTIGVWLLLGQTRADPVFGFDPEPIELPWGELPVLGGGLVVSAVLVFALTHPRSPFLPPSSGVPTPTRDSGPLVRVTTRTMSRQTPGNAFLIPPPGKGHDLVPVR